MISSLLKHHQLKPGCGTDLGVGVGQLDTEASDLNEIDVVEWRGLGWLPDRRGGHWPHMSALSLLGATNWNWANHFSAG